MLLIEITDEFGIVRRESVQQLQFVILCHYPKCTKEFLTIDPDAKYCSPSHRTQACNFRKILSSIA